LLSLIEKALEQQSLLRETQQLLKKTVELEKRLEIVETRLTPVFKSKSMQEIEELINAMAPSEANVLITGESGVGKEVIANLIHHRSRRSERPMVKLNCAAFPQTMIEGELFGYVKGAFTGATNDFSGMIAAAGGSTLFLDEISEMPPDLQKMIEGELFGYVKGAFTGATNDFSGMIAAAGGSTLFLDEISEMPPDLQTRFL